MSILKNIFIFNLLYLVSGCDVAYNEHILGSFYLTATDSMDDLCLSYYDSEFDTYPNIVIRGVYEVLYDHKYIVVKKHPYLDPKFESGLNRKITEYYIAKIVNTKYYDNKDCLGPFKEREFITKKRELGIDKLTLFYLRTN